MADPSTYPNINPSANGSIKDALVNGPVAENVRDQAAKTSSEFQNLANSRTAPAQPAATGQPLTQYHSMFYNLLSWENPRATGISFAATLILILMSRYLHILKYIFKAVYFVLGLTASAEIAGRLVFDNGFTSRIRPKTYYVIPRETLERSLGDVEQLINFFVIESQRILFAEQIPVTVAAFLAAFFAYWLIKIVPFWGLCIIGTSVIYLGPLLYLQNRDTIDGQLSHVSEVVNTQATQLKEMTAQHASRATESVRSYAGEYTALAQDYIGTARKPSDSAPAVPAVKTETPIIKTEPPTPTSPVLNGSALPTAPKDDPLVTSDTTAPTPVAAQ